MTCFTILHIERPSCTSIFLSTMIFHLMMVSHLIWCLESRVCFVEWQVRPVVVVMSVVLLRGGTSREYAAYDAPTSGGVLILPLYLHHHRQPCSQSMIKMGETYIEEYSHTAGKHIVTYSDSGVLLCCIMPSFFNARSPHAAVTLDIKCSLTQANC